MDLGGPVWHASARAATSPTAWRLAERSLLGAGDSKLGEWREPGGNGVVHIRRRLTAAERKSIGGLSLRDIRNTAEERERLTALFSKHYPEFRFHMELQTSGLSVSGINSGKSALGPIARDVSFVDWPMAKPARKPSRPITPTTAVVVPGFSRATSETAWAWLRSCCAVRDARAAAVS